MRLSANETLHLGVFLFRFHPAVNHAHPVFGKHFFECLEPFFQIFIIEVFAFFDKRIDYINLPSLANLAPQKLIDGRFFRIVAMNGFYRFSAGRQLIDNGDIEIALKRHGQGARNGCSCHHKYMRYKLVFDP